MENHTVEIELKLPDVSSDAQSYARKDRAELVSMLLDTCVQLDDTLWTTGFKARVRLTQTTRDVGRDPPKLRPLYDSNDQVRRLQR
jgi:hypothetical protein